MKHLLLCAIFLLPLLAQAQLRDDFADGNFTANPTWTGDAGSFQVAANVLQSNGPAVTGTQIQLVAPCQATTGTTWEFWANLRLATSASNLADVWLMASQPDLRNTATKGYFVRLGGTADEVSLFRKDSLRSAVLVIDGQDGTLATANNLVRVRVTRSPANRWTLERDLTGGRNFVAEAATPTDATHQTSVAVGVSLLYSSANGRNFYFDDFAVTDATPPLLAGAAPVDARQVEVRFNEAVDAVSAEDPANYRLAGGPAPNGATLSASNPAVVRLLFGADLPATSTLEVRNVADRFGNIAGGPLTAALVALPSAPAMGDLLITEILADETPQVGLPLSEYVEIFNRSATKTLSLRGVRLGKTGTVATAVFPDTARLRPGQFAIVCGSTRVAQFAAFNAKVYGLPNFPALNNAGDQLVLRGPGGRTLFEVHYADTWYGDVAKKDGGYSLEMLDPNNYCAGADNWRASTDPAGGTPGRANSVAANNPDNAPPTLLRAELSDPLTLRLTFSEKLDSTRAANPARYALAPGPGIAAVVPVAPDFRLVDLTLTAPLSATQRTTVTVQMATDCAGNVSGPLQAVSFAEPSSAPLVGELVITEILVDETPVVGLPASEYLEIFNRSTKLLNLGGVRLGKGGSSTTAVFPDTARLRPGQYAIVCGSTRVAQFAAFNAKVYGLPSFPALTNGGDQLILRGRNGQTLFEVTYSDTWYGDPNKQDGGYSLEMLDTDNLCAGAANWHASADPSGGTPGRRNSVAAPNPDRTAPTLLRALAVDATTLRLFFSEKLDSTAATNPARYALAAPGPAVARAAPVAPDFRLVDLTLAAPLTAGQALTLTVQAATDCAGNASGPLQSAAFALPEPAAAGDVVLNELLFNPRTGGVRFAEFINRSAKFINLQGFQLAREKADGSSDVAVLSTGPLVLGPGQLLAFSTSTANLQTEYPTSHDDANLLEIASFPTFDYNAGVAVLLDNQGLIIDRFEYNKSLHLPLLSVQDGVSLERIRTNGPTNGSNFHSAAGAVGYATPGRPNSQGQDAVGGGQDWAVSPEVFTPDDDGQQDLMLLTYQLDQPGYAGTVTVYDALGRLTRRLLRNETLPISGAVQWDGVDERGQKAAVGYYILHIDLFRASGGERRELKRTVVLGARF